MLFCTALLAESASPSLDARQIYLHVRNVVNADADPPYIVFTYQDATKETVAGHHRFDGERLEVAVRTSDGHAFVQTLRTVSGYQGHIDSAVVGDNAIFPNTGAYRLGDFPLADFGLHKNKTRPGVFEVASPPEPLPTGDTLRVIGSVSAVNVPYRLTRLNDDVINGRPMYHLSLSPLRDPGHNVLREMWVDQETFEPLRYVAERFVGSPTAFSYPVTVERDRIAGVYVNTSLTGHFSTPLIGHIGLPGEISPFPNERLADVTWRISGVSFPQTLPKWLFDPNTFKTHKGDPLPIALQALTAPPPLPSLRHLVFNFALGTDQAKPNANARAETEVPVQRPTTQGQIIIDVVAATADRGLVLDVHQTPDDAEPIARVAISHDGELFYDSRITLTQQEIILLKLLGRDVIGAQARQPGDTWTIPQALTENNDRSTLFRVVSVLPSQSELLDVTESATQSSGEPLHRIMSGTVIYNPPLSVPLSALLVLQNGFNRQDTTATGQATVSLKLFDDSFSPKGRT